VRAIPGIALVAIGLSVLRRVGGVWGAAVPAIIGAGAVALGALVLFAPWWLDTALDLSRERRDRVRAEERAEMVTHLHDSVLQTLTLIERVASNEADVRRLARNQERELRAWLYNPASANADVTTFAGLLRALEADIEDDYGISVDVVIVGDCAADEAVTAIVAAAREAVLNAAKWSSATTVSVFGEVEPAAIDLYVRDTGVGFDPASVPADRHGITTSIVDRMSRVGGTATVTSSPGRGTEVALQITRKAP